MVLIQNWKNYTTFTEVLTTCPILAKISGGVVNLVSPQQPYLLMLLVQNLMSVTIRPCLVK